jgi:anti-anti-sigma regulatory factor
MPAKAPRSAPRRAPKNALRGAAGDAPVSLVEDAARTGVLRLPPELTIYTAAETRTAWLNWLADQAGHEEALCAVNASACDEIDAAGAQLLVALAHSLARQQRQLQLQEASTAVRHACRDLGLTGWLAATDDAEVPA